MNNDTDFLPDIKLQFNVKYPNLEECYIFGYECALADVGESENPYPINSKESNEWLEGWWAGFYGNKPLFHYSGNKFSDRITNGKLTKSEAANDGHYQDHKISNMFKNFVEITSVVAVSALVAYQLIDLVA